MYMVLVYYVFCMCVAMWICKCLCQQVIFKDLLTYFPTYMYVVGSESPVLNGSSATSAVAGVATPKEQRSKLIMMCERMVCVHVYVQRHKDSFGFILYNLRICMYVIILKPI